MAKNDEITLIIAKAFSRQPLTEKEKDACCSLTISELISKHCLNDIQAKLVMEWCALQKANIAYEQKEDLLSEGLFSNLFKKKSSNKYNKIIKSYIATAKQNEDDQHISLFLSNVAKIASYIQKRGLSTYEKKATPSSAKGQERLLDKALDIENSNARLSASSESLKNLKEIVDFVKGLHDAISTDKPKITSARRKSVKENREISRHVNKSRRKIDHALLTLKNYTKRPVFNNPAKMKRAVEALIKTILKEKNIKSAKDKKALGLEIKNYLGEVYKEINSIYNAEKQVQIDKSI